MKSLSVLASVGALATSTLALNPIEVHEQQFIDSKTGDRFMVLGVDYQPGGQGSYGTDSGDPLSDPEICLRDAALMQNLGVNTIRSYNIDPTLDHDQCVSIFNQAGIYMIIDVNSPLPGESIDRSNPQGTYTSQYLQRVFSVVEAFKDYPNVLGFFGGNEIINDVPTAQDNPPVIRAVQRDMKNYIKNHASRTIPVGYSAADVREVLEDSWAYLQCQIGSGTDMSRSDFFGLNSYSWCGDASNFQISGYDVLAEMFGNTTIPVFFSEYGCNDPQPRYFDEVQALYGPQMTTLSGGLVYEWTQEESDYGIINVYSNGSAELRPDYNVLMQKYNSLDKNLITASNDTATSLQPPQCDSSLISTDGFSTDFDIPDPPQGAQQLIDNGIKNPPSGSIVRVTQTVVQVPVYATNGGPLEGLKIASRSAANLPGADSLSTGAPGSTPTVTGGSGGSSSSSSSSGMAAAPTAANFGVLANAVGAAAFGVAAFAL